MSTIKEDAERLQESVKVECGFCGLRFAPKRRWQRFCSSKCRLRGYWKTHEVVKRTISGD
jgi:endogenous inhibitor of DNA gyrase (YacG/DUF329 family)